MPWISLAATRHRFIADVDEYYRDPDHEVIDEQPIDARPGYDVMISGTNRYLEREIKRSTGLLRLSGAERKLVPDMAREVFGLAVLAWVGGQEVMPIIESISKSKALRSPEAKRLQLIARWLMDPKSAPRSKQVRRGHVRNEKEWFRVVEQTAPEESLDLALTPDHGDWPVLSTFVLPLAMLVAVTQGGDRAMVPELLRMGAHAERRGKVLYERNQPQADFDEAVVPGDRGTWPSFAAVEVKGEDLFAYHYMGIRWKAPLLFDPESDLNAFDFLDHVDLSWRIVKDNVAETDWQRIKQLRDRGRCRHVVVFDSAEADAPEDDLKAAAEHYRLNLETRDLMEV